MGIVLIFGMLAGVALGVASSTMFGVFVYSRIHGQSKTRAYPWRPFLIVMIVLMFLLVVGFHFYPLPEARPGSDYEIVFKNWFLSGLWYAASPGVAAILAWFATFVLSRENTKESER